MTENRKEYSQSGPVTTILTNSAELDEWTLNISDIHFDSVYCNRDLLSQHLEEAAARQARINIYGDWFDGMQGRWDPRRSYPLLRDKYKHENYFDLLVMDSIEFLNPYAHLIDIIADGNHELSILKANNTNLSDRLVSSLRMMNPDTCRAIHGGYGGWIRYLFNFSDTPDAGPRNSIRLKYYHGSGGEAPVTRGAIQTSRQAVYLPDADIIVNGHSHHAYYIPIVRERISRTGKLYMDVQHHIRTPGYMQSYGDGTTGWEVTKGGVPKPIGAMWTRFYRENQTLKIQVVPAIQGPEALSISTEGMYNGKTYDEDCGG